MTRPARFLLITNASSTSPSTPTAEPPSVVAVESDFVVILAALLCALICVVGLIAVARCAWLRRITGAGGGGTGGQSSEAANKGLKKKVLRSLPKFTYNPSSTTAKATPFTAECAICLAEYAVGDEIRVLPQCGHSFHLLCIDTWLGSHSSCPSCRQILVVARCRKCGELPAVSHKTDGAPTTTSAESRSCASSTVGTKLQGVVTRMAIEITERHAVVQGIPLVQGSDKYFWFGRPQLYEYGLKSCFHDDFELVIAKIVVGAGVLFVCSYITCPLYALITQMGSNMKKSTFDEQTSKAVKKWHMAVKKRKGASGDRSPTRAQGSASPRSTMSSPGRPCSSLVHNYRSFVTFPGLQQRSRSIRP